MKLQPFPASAQLTRAQDDCSLTYSRSGAGFIPLTTKSAGPWEALTGQWQLARETQPRY